MKTLILAAIGAACLVCVLAYSGAAQSLGAHPWWAFEVSLYGAVPGILLAVVLSFVSRFAVVFAFADLVLAGFVAWWGKRGFAASSGDDALAGQLWFFGWIAVCACAVALIALVVARLRAA